jgi:hypothetical protein
VPAFSVTGYGRESGYPSLGLPRLESDRRRLDEEVMNANPDRTNVFPSESIRREVVSYDDLTSSRYERDPEAPGCCEEGNQ